MARNLDPKCKKCRREGKKLFLKGERCYGVKCAMVKRPYAPGQHGQGGKRMGLSEYGMQLREKQKVKRTYGIMERQFRKYYDMASKTRGSTGIILASLLERRLDNIVYKLGFATSRDQARQLVNHNHFLVNGKKANIPSYLVDEGDIISVRNEKKGYFQNLRNSIKNYQTPSWLTLDHQKLQGKVVALPTMNEIEINGDIQLVVQYYSKF